MDKSDAIRYFAARAPKAVRSRAIRYREFGSALDFTSFVSISSGGLSISLAALCNAAQVAEKNPAAPVPVEGTPATLRLSPEAGVIDIVVPDKPASPVVPLSFSFTDPAIRARALASIKDSYGALVASRIQREYAVLDQALPPVAIYDVLQELERSPASLEVRIASQLESGELIFDTLFPPSLRYYTENICPLWQKEDETERSLREVFNSFRLQRIGIDLREGLRQGLYGALRSDLDLMDALRGSDPDRLKELLGDFLKSRCPIVHVGVASLALELSLEAPALTEVLRAATQLVCDDGDTPKDGWRSAEVMPALINAAEAQFEAAEELRFQPTTWRRLCTWVHAGHLLDVLDGLALDEKSFVQWCNQREISDVRRMVDHSRGPMWPLRPMDRERLHGELMGRLTELSNRRKDEVMTAEITKSVLRRGLEGRLSLMFGAGPLEGDKRPVDAGEGRLATPEVTAKLQEICRDEPSLLRIAEQFSNAAGLFGIGSLLEVLRERTRAAQFTEGDKPIDALLSLIPAATSQRDYELARIVAERLLDLGGETLDHQELYAICLALICLSGTFATEMERERWLSDQLGMLARRVKRGKPASVLVAVIKHVGQYMSESDFARAGAIASLAEN